MNKEYLECLAIIDLKTYHYKILLLLNIKPHSQAEISALLKIKRQNINKYFKELECFNLIEIDRKEGRNIFFKPVTDVKLITEQMKSN